MNSVYKLLFALSPNPPLLPNLQDTILSQQRNLPITSLGHKMLSVKLRLSLLSAFPILHSSCLSWKECQPDRIKAGSSRFYQKSFTALILSVKWITTLAAFNYLYYLKMLHFQRKYLKKTFLEYLNRIYCIEFCFHEVCLHMGIGTNSMCTLNANCIMFNYFCYLTFLIILSQFKL